MRGYSELQATEQEGVGPADLPTPDGSQPGACYCRGLSSPNKQHQTPRYGGPHGGSCPAPCSQSLVPAATSPPPCGAHPTRVSPRSLELPGHKAPPGEDSQGRTGHQTQPKYTPLPQPWTHSDTGRQASLSVDLGAAGGQARPLNSQAEGSPCPCTASSENSGSLHNQAGGSRPM